MGKNRFKSALESIDVLPNNITIINATKTPLTFLCGDDLIVIPERPYTIAVKHETHDPIRHLSGAELQPFSFVGMDFELSNLNKLKTLKPELIILGSVPTMIAYPGLVHGVIPIGARQVLNWLRKNKREDDVDYKERFSQDSEFAVFCCDKFMTYR